MVKSRSIWWKWSSSWGFEHKSSCPQTWRLTSAIEQSFKGNISYSFKLSTRLSSLSWELEQYFEWPDLKDSACLLNISTFFQLTDWLTEKKSGTTINHFKILEQVQKEEYSKKGKVWKILSRFWCKFIQLFLSDFPLPPATTQKQSFMNFGLNLLFSALSLLKH